MNMRIKRLELENFRGFQKAAVDFPEGNVAVFFGWNGAGKTAVLDAVSTVLSSILFAKSKGKDFALILTDDDIMIGQKKVVVKSVINYLGEDREVFEEKEVREDGNEKFEKKTRQDIWAEHSPTLPIIAYYRTNRELPTEKSNEFSRSLLPLFNSRTYAYSTAINAQAGTFFDFTAWLRYAEDIENEYKIEHKDLNYEDSQLRTIRNALSSFLLKMDADFSGLRVRRKSNEELDFSKPSQKSELFILKARQEIKISQLSSGERSLILLVADIARRAAILNPQLSYPLQCSGIVLIDEIELHLHPKWQRAVIPALQATFPNIQFIIATHSPQVLSEVENGGVFEIDNFQINPRATYGRDNNWLLHVIMEDDERPEEVQEALEEYFRVIRNGDLDKAGKLRQQIEEKIGTDEPELVKADILLRRKERALAS
jgi:predicted ATP-binding protein involved in virulence